MRRSFNVNPWAVLGLLAVATRGSPISVKSVTVHSSESWADSSGAEKKKRIQILSFLSSGCAVHFSSIAMSVTARVIAAIVYVGLTGHVLASPKSATPGNTPCRGSTYDHILCTFPLTCVDNQFTRTCPISRRCRPNFIFILADDWGWGDLGADVRGLVSVSLHLRSPTAIASAASAHLESSHSPR